MRVLLIPLGVFCLVVASIGAVGAVTATRAATATAYVVIFSVFVVPGMFALIAGLDAAVPRRTHATHPQSRTADQSKKDSVMVQQKPTANETKRKGRWKWLRTTGIVIGGLFLVGFALGLADALTSTDDTANSNDRTPINAFDRIVGVAIACTYQALQAAPGGAVPVVRDGTGDYCPAEGKARVGDVVIRSVTNRRAIVTVRTPQGGSYVVETTDLNVRVGQPWHP